MNLLIIEDEAGIRNQYKWGLKGHVISMAEDANSAIEMLDKQTPEIVLLDLGLPPDPDNASVGLKLLSDIKVCHPNTRVIVLTGSEQREHAREAIRLGAASYLQKGVDIERVQSAIDQAALHYELEQENRSLKSQNVDVKSTLLGHSEKMMETMRLMSRVAPSDISTLLNGESGTGKELFAQNLHRLSGRTGEIIAINCASIPGELLESELFGHERGAFTGAVKAKKGKVEQANGGTLFLDEIGDMPLELQSKMLRFLQERKIERVGGSKQIDVDVRIICATHRDLKQMTKQKIFREDLYFRLAEFELKIPPLRERDQDVLLIAEHMLGVVRNTERNVSAKSFGSDAVSAMLHHKWPGNIRELQSRVRRAGLLCDGEVIGAVHLDLPFKESMLYAPSSWLYGSQVDDDATLTEMEEDFFARILFERYRKFSFNISETAESLGISRPTFYARAKRYGLRAEEPAHSKQSEATN
ncbi:PEP-CTERM-box response regulator transcription factor [Alteromonas sp. 14N.309.X.WAT.G.H12]|uniref:PEP-CTERM-box response regulator transcription factor n=1 Tax=Alteromonas sp. 14N.309.X.WAT.G.H12 TaxID=3120824 RepID=UPI002FD76E1D